MTGGGLIQLLTVGIEDAPLILNPEITFFKTVYRKHTNFSIEQIVKNIGTKKFDCFHQFKIEKVTDLLAGLHFIIDIPYFDVLKTITTKIITNPDIININEFSIMYSNIKTYLFFESISNKYYLIPENFFNLSEIDNYTNTVDGIELEKNLLKDLNIINSQNYSYLVDILELKNSTLNQLVPVFRLNFGQWSEFWLKIIDKKENFNYFTRLISQLSLIEELNKKINLIIFEKFNNYNIFYKYKENLNFTDEIKNYYFLEDNEIENPIFDSDYALNYAIKNNLDIDKYTFETLKFNSLFFLFLLQTLYPDFTTNIKSFTFWKKYNLFKNNIVNNELPILSNNYFLEWLNRFNFYKLTSYGDYEKLNIEIYNKFIKKYNECETNINLLFNTIDIKEKEKLWAILYTISLRFNNKDNLFNSLYNKICFNDNDNSRSLTSLSPDYIKIDNEISKNYQLYDTFLTNINLKENLTNFDQYGYIQPVDLSLIYVYLCYKYLDLIINNNIFINYHFLVLWRNKINIAYFFRTAEILDNYNSDNTENSSLKNVFYSLHDYNESKKTLTFSHNINLTRDINLDIIRDELIKTIYSESFYGTIDISSNDYFVNTINMSSYSKIYNDISNNYDNYDIINQTIEISEDLTVPFIINDTQIIINDWNRNIFNQLFIKYNSYYIEIKDFEIKDNIVYITNQNLKLDNLSEIDIRTKNTFKIPIVDINDISGNSLCDISENRIILNRIDLYVISDNYIIINNINNKQIFCDISYNQNYFYQLNIEYIDGIFERINVDFSNNYFVSELDLKYNKIKKIILDCIDLKLELLQTNITSIDNINNGDETDTLWLIATSLNNKKIPKEIFISYNLNPTKNGDISSYINYSWSLYRINKFNKDTIPNLFSILNFNEFTNDFNNRKDIKYSINQYFYQLPMIFKVVDISNHNIPLYIFYNINMSENASIKLNNKNVIKLCPIISSDFYRIKETVERNPLIDGSGNILLFDANGNIILLDASGFVIDNNGDLVLDDNGNPIVGNNNPLFNPIYNETIKSGLGIPIIFEYNNLETYKSKSDIIKILIEKFNEIFINNISFGNIINLLEKSTKLYKDLIVDSIQLLKDLGKSIEYVIDTSTIINELNLLKYNNRDFDIYSVLAPKCYNLSSASLGMNTINLSENWYILKQIKEIYKPSNKISYNLTNYLKNVSITMLKHIEYLNDNKDFQNIFNKNQYQEKYNYAYILENEINHNIIKIDNYTIKTLYDMSNNYSNNNTEIYFNHLLIDISSNNVVSGTNLFEIGNENLLLTEKFIENKDDYSKEKFNYLGPVEFKNKNFNFNNNTINIQYILTDDLQIIDLSSVDMINLKTYYNSYQISINSSYDISSTSTKYIYELEIPSYSVDISLNKGILISGNYYNFFKNNNYILIGEQELILTPYAIIGDSSGSMRTFIPKETINILNIKILNGFKSNIKLSNNQTNKLIKLSNNNQYKLIDSITNRIETYYSIESTTNIQLYDFSKNQLLSPFNIINNQISYNYDNKNFIIESFNNDYWYKLDTNIIQGFRLEDFNISGNYNLYLYPNKFLKLIDISLNVDISNGTLTGLNINLPKYSYYYINNYVYFIKDISSSYRLDDYFVGNNTISSKVYLLDDSNFKNCHSQYISVVDINSSETILPSEDINQNNNNFYKLVSNYSYDFKNKDYIKDKETELDLYVTFNINTDTFIRPINFTLNTNIFRVNLKSSSINYGNFLCYRQNDLSNNEISGTITDISSILFSSDKNFDISGYNFTLTSKEGIQKYKLLDNSNNYTYVWTLLLDSNNINFLNLSRTILDPINISSYNNSTLIIDLSNYTVNINNNKLLDVSNGKLYFINYFTNITRKQMYYSSSIIERYSLEKLEYNYNSSDIIYCNLDDVGIIEENNINGNQLIISNFDIYKYIILIDTSSNYKYCNVLSSDKLLNKIIVDDEIEKRLYNVYGFKRNLIFTKNESHIWKSSINYYLDTKKNSLFTDDIIMLNDNIFKVIGLNSLKNLYEIELIRKYNDLKLFSDGYYLLYSKNILPNIPKYEPIVDFTFGNIDGYKFHIDNSENLVMNNSIGKFCIKQGNFITLYYKNGKLYNPFNYFLNNDDYLVYNDDLYKINFISNNIIYLDNIPDNLSNDYYDFYYPYQPCFMENLIFDTSGTLINYYQKNIEYYFEYQNQFIKNTNSLFNTSLYTRVLKLSKNQYYFENKENYYIKGIFDGSNVIINEDLSGYDFFYNQPILINNMIKFIKYTDGSNFTVTDNFIKNGDDSQIYSNEGNVKIYFAKRNIQKIYSNYLLDKVNYFKPELNLGLYHHYKFETTIYNKISSLEYKDNNYTVIFEDNVYAIDKPNNFLNFNNSYHILLEKTENDQFVSHICIFEFPNILKFFFGTSVENYKSKFYLDKIYPIKLNVNNSFEFLDLIIYKQKIINKKPSNQIKIWKKFNISVIGLIETITDGYCVKVEIGDLSNYINKYDIYIDKITKCTIDLSGSIYYLKTSNYPGEFEYLYTKQINYITTLTKNKFSNLVKENNIFKKNFGLESIKFPIKLQFIGREGINNYIYEIDDYNSNNYFNELTYNFSVNYLNLNILVEKKIVDGDFKIFITSNEEIEEREQNEIFNSIIYINNIQTNIFDEFSIQNDIENILEEIIIETDFQHSILLNKLKSWNSWSILTNPETEKNIYLINGPLNYSGSSFNFDGSGKYFTNIEISDLSKSLTSKIFTIEKYLKLKYYQEKIYKHLNVFFKYSNFWKDPITYINNFAIDISSQLIFDGSHLKLNNEILDDIIINNQFDISYVLVPLKIYVTRDINLAKTEIYNFINNKQTNIVYGVKILDVLKELVTISNELNNIKSMLKNFSFETKNFGDLLLNVFKNQLYGNLSNFNINITKLQTLFSVENFQINGIDVKNNFITYDSSYNFGNIILEYPTDTFKIMNMINTPYNTNYSIDTNSGLYPYKITLFDEKYKSYTIYKLDFLSGINTITEPATIENPLVFNNQINFYFKENFDINLDYVISSFKTYDVSAQFLGYLYKVDISSINFNDFTLIKYKKVEFSSYNTLYDNYLVSPIFLESFSSYIQAETPIGIYEYDISNNTTRITLVKLNISINLASSEYNTYYNDNSNYYKIEDISNNIITINSVINQFINPKIVITIKSPNNCIFNKTKLYRLTLYEPLISYSDYINLKNVPKNFLINDEIKVIDMKFITDSIIDVLVESSLSETYKINNLVHYTKIGEYPPEPIIKIDKENLYLYRFNNVVPINDISSCFILYDTSYNKHEYISGYIKGSLIIDNFIKDISSYKFKYNLSNDVIQDENGIKFITNKFLLDEQLHTNVFGGIINSFDISNYIYNLSKNTITFTIPQNLVIDSDYYYILNNIYIDISNISVNQNNLIINWNNSAISGIILFKQVIIEKEIIKPKHNQIYNIELFNNFDLNNNGYLQVLNREGNEVGQFIYKIIDTSINDLSNTYDVLINNSTILKGTILYKNPLHIITNQLIKNINSLTIVDSSITLNDISAVLIQKTYIPYEIYKSIGLKNYKLLIQQNNIFDIVNFNFKNTDENKYSIISRYGNFKLEKTYQNQKIEPTPELVFNLETTVSYLKTNQTTSALFNSDIYRNIFENIDFCIGDQIIERLDKSTFEMQYQFLKDPQKKNQIDKVTKIYDYEGKMRLMIPLEFWFSNQANMYLPLISLPYTDVSLKFKLNKLNELLGSNHTIISEPNINIQVSIDGIILDTFEREMFGNNKHEYLIERFMQYPDNLIDNTSSTIKMIFKNPIKDIYYKTEISGSSDTCYYKTKIIMDDWQKEYKNKRALYNEFIKTNIYTNDISNNNSKDFEIIRTTIRENILQNSVRYILFNKSNILINYDMEMTIYLDEKYQKNLLKLKRRKYNLELYYTKIYNYKEIKTPISIIESMVIKSNGTDLFKEISHAYFNKIVPYQKYLNSVDMGYFGYSFSLNPLDNQPSGHLNFSLLDDIVLKSKNNSQVVTKPVILKTIVREYNLLRIMSGLSSLAWID